MSPSKFQVGDEVIISPRMPGLDHLAGKRGIVEKVISSGFYNILVISTQEILRLDDSELKSVGKN